MPEGRSGGRPDPAGPPAPGPAWIDDPTAALYTVGQVADMLGVQHAFLRRLDAADVVSPIRSAGGQRRYTRDEIGRVERVTTLMDEGMSLASVRRIIELEAEVRQLRQQLHAAGAERSPRPGR